LYRKEILELPPEALREALLNAVIHRDYHFDTARISVEVYKDRVEISSPGGLPPGLKPEEFGKKSVHRNRLIAEMFQRLGEVERAGAGIRKMRDAIKAAGLRPPRFEFTTFFTITFWRPEAQAGALAEGLQEMADLSAIPLSPMAIRILNLCRSPMSPTELMKSLGHKKRTGGFVRTVKYLMTSGLLKYTIPVKPRSVRQKYLVTGNGIKVLEQAIRASENRKT
jgi:ATP-dependent DNA helicase RecG